MISITDSDITNYGAVIYSETFDPINELLYVVSYLSLIFFASGSCRPTTNTATCTILCINNIF